MTLTHLDPDAYGAASHRNQRDNLIPVLQAGAADEELVIGGNGRVEVAWTREPLVVVAPRVALGTEALEVTVTLDPAGAKTPLGVLRFEPFTDAGSFLAVWPVGGVLTPSPFTIGLTARRFPRDEASAAVKLADLAGLLTVHLIEGVLGRLLYVCSAEKQRIRRVAREVAAARSLGQARASSLDLHGRDLGVARFTEALSVVKGPPLEIVTVPRKEPGGRESDAAYRWRLLATRSLRMATKASVLEALNGPGEAGDPPTGALAALGKPPTARLQLDDRPARFALAVHLVAGGDDQARRSFLAQLRRDRLVRPIASAAVTAAYNGRFVTPEQRTALTALGTQLTDGFDFTGDAATDPALSMGTARALVRTAACRRALGVTARWRLTRAQLDDGGNRYELGLGVDLAMPTSAQVTKLRQSVLDPNRAPHADPEIEALLQAMAASDPDPNDTELRWLLEPCGMETVHRVSGSTLFVSPVPMQGLTITAPSVAPLAGWSHLVAGPLLGTGSWYHQLLRYSDVEGRAELVRLGEAGEEAVLGTYTGWRKTWAEVLAFEHRDPTARGEGGGVLLYDRGQGDIAVVRFDQNGNATTTAQVSTWRSTWRLLATGRFSAAADVLTDVARYDPTTGDLEVVGLRPDGSEQLIDRRPGQRSTWTSMVAIHLDDDRPTDALLLYDRVSGSVEIYRVGDNGRLVLLRNRGGWRPGFTHLVAAPRLVMGRRSAQLVGYDREAGIAEVLGLAADGRLRNLGVLPAGRRLWSQLVAGAIVPGRTTDIAFYNRAAGWFVALGGPISVPPELQSEEESTTPPESGGVQLHLTAFRFWPGGPDLAVEGRVLGANDAPSHVLLGQAVARATQAWADRGGEAWTTVVAPAAQSTIWNQVVAPSAAAVTTFTAAGLPLAPSSAKVTGPLDNLPGELVATLQLGPTLSGQILGGGGVDQLRGLVGVLSAAGFDAALGLVTGPQQVTIVVGVIGLPFAGLNLSDRRSTGFRWYAVPVGDLPGVIKPVGSRTVFRPVDRGVTALVAVARLRGDRPDPYEFRVDLPQGVTLDLHQYELVMNLLDEWHPAGVEVNTWRLRREHVDLTGDGVAEPLNPSLATTFRRYRRRASAS